MAPVVSVPSTPEAPGLCSPHKNGKNWRRPGFVSRILDRTLLPPGRAIDDHFQPVFVVAWPRKELRLLQLKRSAIPAGH